MILKDKISFKERWICLRFNEIFLKTIYLNVALIRLYLLSKPGKLIKFKAAYIQK